MSTKCRRSLEPAIVFFSKFSTARFVVETVTRKSHGPSPFRMQVRPHLPTFPLVWLSLLFLQPICFPNGESGSVSGMRERLLLPKLGAARDFVFR
ncbi:hypothetical protein AVEN_186718-1 [Araneus ventricosus]|uniref:Uncharacterized protein n=1 Tax=Araneus ventricosus TaxID=182803 RepID=A0A4Y2J9J1_ARAVE|nr:hypothetical protein AVEN_186718-1 [Araneus ventricosus]